MSFTLSLASISKMLTDHGKTYYGGEAISQLEHALQCGALAEQAREPTSMIIAAFLHDIGHLLGNLNDTTDDRHQEAGANALVDLFGPDVSEPIRLHVPAKRYLCFAEPGYYDALSAASKRTLALQGGVFSVAQAKAFESEPYAKAALRIRRYDDAGKVVGMITPDLPYFLGLAEQLLVTPSRAEQ